MHIAWLGKKSPFCGNVTYSREVTNALLDRGYQVSFLHFAQEAGPTRQEQYGVEHGKWFMGKGNCSNLIYQFALARELQRSLFTLSLQIANLYDSHSQVPHSADEISAAAETRCCSRFPDAFAPRLSVAGNLSRIEFASGGDFSPAVRSQIAEFDIGNPTPDVSTLCSVFG